MMMMMMVVVMMVMVMVMVMTDWRCVLKVQFYLIHISNTLEVLNSSVNFFIYFAYHRYFRSAVTSCHLFVSSSRRARTQTGRDSGGARSQPATQPDAFRLQELEADGQTAANNHPQLQQQQRQQQPRYGTASSSDADLSWRTNSQSADNSNHQTAGTKMSQSSQLAS